LSSFKQNFSKLNLKELSEKSKSLQQDVEQRILDLNEFKLNFSLELYPKTEVDNQIGRIVVHFDEDKSLYSLKSKSYLGLREDFLTRLKKIPTKVD
jgi:hypothetical protein